MERQQITSNMVSKETREGHIGRNSMRKGLRAQTGRDIKVNWTASENL